MFTEQQKQERLKQLDSIQIDCTQNQGTERPFKGIYWKNFEKGRYNCIICGSKLFDSQHKFDTSCGWPAFNQCEKNTLKEINDNSYGMKRVEVRCAKCDAHQGHVFEDGPLPTKLRYCINSACIDFQEK